MRLAGTYHPITYLLSKIPTYIPGLRSVDAIWYSENKEVLCTFGSGAAHGENKMMFQKWRKTDEKLMWVSGFDPLQTNHLEKGQLTFKDEEKLSTLLLFFPSVVDDHQDLIAITFPEHLFLRNFNLEFSGISTHEKAVLSNLLSSILHTEHKRCLEERQFLKRLNMHDKNKSEQINSLTAQLSAAENLYSSAIYGIIKELLFTYEKEWNIQFDLDTELVKYFAKEKLPLSDIKIKIESIATMAYHLNIGESKVLLDTSFIQPSMHEDKELNIKINDDVQKDKVHDLLDRYEKAAQRVNDAHVSLNAKEIAKRLNPPVTPPAITDAIKKNKRKIAYYLRQYPDKWNLIRTAIRPIRMIDENQTNSRYNIS